jgi:hypothetical protein
MSLVHKVLILLGVLLVSTPAMGRNVVIPYEGVLETEEQPVTRIGVPMVFAIY